MVHTITLGETTAKRKLGTGARHHDVCTYHFEPLSLRPEEEGEKPKGERRYNLFNISYIQQASTCN